MDTALITGGTGHLGRDLIPLLSDRYRVRVLTRSPGPNPNVADPNIEWVRGDLATGSGIAAAVEGAQLVVHAATWSPAARRGYFLPSDFVRSPSAVEVSGTARLLDAASAVGAGHFLYVSIVGIERQGIPYARQKLVAETLVRRSKLAWSIARATPFHWLLDRLLTNMMRLPVLPVPSEFVTQPVDTGDFAGYLDQRVSAGPGGDVDDFGGPEVLGMDAIVEAYQHARALHRRVLRVPLPQAARRTAEAGLVTAGRRGTTTWSQWLARTYAASQPETGSEPGTGEAGTGDAGSVHMRAGFRPVPHFGRSALKTNGRAPSGADSPS
ncbi:MAG: SDR family oxidoreductase [Frankiaceae bacterium]